MNSPRRRYVRRARAWAQPKRQPDTETLAGRMRQFQLFAHLSADLMLELAVEARVQEYRAREYLWRQGEQNHRVLFIEQGLAIASRQVREGVSRTYGLFGPGDSMGIHAIWAGMCYPTDALVLSPGEMRAAEI